MLRSIDAAGTAWLLAHMHEHADEHMAPYHHYDSRAKRHISSLDERMLLQLRNVGPDMAKRLLNRFGSLVGVVNAGRDELMSVEGVGRFIAGQILLLRGGGK